MILLVDTSVWSLALRRDSPGTEPEVGMLQRALGGAAMVVTTGIILQELLQGFVPGRSHDRILAAFSGIRMIQPRRADYVDAASLRNACRRAGVQLGTIDALIAQVAIRYDLTLLTTDQDFRHAAKACPLRIWAPDPNEDEVAT